jgi:inner membrane protein involved in colicin E2 resistance
MPRYDEIEFLWDEAMFALPLGAMTQVRLDSAGSVPEFRGRYRPVELSEHDAGFTAVWRIRALSRASRTAALPAVNFGVGFEPPGTVRTAAQEVSAAGARLVKEIVGAISPR